MKFNYYLTGVGWAKMILEINSSIYKSCPSHLSDPLKDLLEVLINLVFNEAPEAPPSFFIEMEPQVDIWNFKLLEDNKLKIVINRLEDNYTDESEVIFNETCALHDFITVVIKNLELLIREYGIIGYEKTWNRYDFPLSNFLKLKHYLLYKYKLTVKETERYIFKSCLNEEIDLLKNNSL